MSATTTTSNEWTACSTSNTDPHIDLDQKQQQLRTRLSVNNKTTQPHPQQTTEEAHTTME